MTDDSLKYSGRLSKQKNAIRRRLTKLLTEGKMTEQDVLSADDWGLLMSDVADAVEAKPVRPGVFPALSRAMDRLEGGGK